jgi:hypothetical protein
MLRRQSLYNLWIPCKSSRLQYESFAILQRSWSVIIEGIRLDLMDDGVILAEFFDIWHIFYIPVPRERLYRWSRTWRLRSVFALSVLLDTAQPSSTTTICITRTEYCMMLRGLCTIGDNIWTSYNEPSS